MPFDVSALYYLIEAALYFKRHTAMKEWKITKF